MKRSSERERTYHRASRMEFCSSLTIFRPVLPSDLPLLLAFPERPSPEWNNVKSLYNS
jgi:hypothetical protein